MNLDSGVETSNESNDCSSVGMESTSEDNEQKTSNCRFLVSLNDEFHEKFSLDKSKEQLSLFENKIAISKSLSLVPVNKECFMSSIIKASNSPLSYPKKV